MTDQNSEGARIIDLTNVRRIPRVNPRQQTDDVLDFLGALGDGHTGTEDCPKCAELKAEFGIEVPDQIKWDRTIYMDVSADMNPMLIGAILASALGQPTVRPRKQRKQSWMERNAHWIIVGWLTLMGVLAVLGGILMSLQ